MTKQEFLAASLTKNLKVKILCGDGVFDTIDTLTIGNLYELGFNRLTPILRPLSDLTKEIEHKGERFVPIVKLMQIAYEIQDSDITPEKIYVKDNLHTVKISDVEFAFDADDNSFISMLHNFFSAVPKQLELFQKLISWHFNLMDIGEEFIDVNTLEENPYK